MFLKIAKEQTNDYKENLKTLIYQGNNIIEFCSTPILDNKMRISKYKTQELKKIISTIQKTTNSLEEILKLYEK